MYTLYMFIYNIIAYVIQPFIWFFLLWRSIRMPEYRKNWLERYALYYFYRKISLNSIVLHAVSIGETVSIIPLIHELKRNYPNTIITLTSMTPTGLKLARQIALKYKNIQCTYLPYDLSGSIKRFINYFQPKLVIVLETELWPNLINFLYKKKIPFIIINARLSYYSFIKYKKLHHFFSLIMKRITFVAARSEEDAFRFLKLGLSRNKLYITGDLKFDIKIDPDKIKQAIFLKKHWIKHRFTWIAGSTHVGEEKFLLDVHKTLLMMFPNLLMIISPRHPERCLEVSKMVKNYGFSYIMKTDGLVSLENIQVVINNTVGELIMLYGVSDIAFVGGSLVRYGGHNPLEPIIYSKPVIVGPYTFNFNNICNELYRSDGLIRVQDTNSLISIMSMLLVNYNLRSYYSVRASEVLKKNQGASYKVLKLIYRYFVF